MVMEALGGSMPAGQPVSAATSNRSHVFAIAAGGGMNHWISKDGGPWSGPTQLPGGNLVASVPCAIALPSGSVHVFAIANGGALTHWSSLDGDTWTCQVDPSIPIPGGWNGLAVASPGGQRLDVFATTAGGIIQFTYDGNQASRSPLPGSGGLPVRLLAAVSPAPGQIDVFAVDPNIRMPVHWHFNGAWSAKQIIGGPAHQNSGLAAVATAPGSVALLAITPDAKIFAWSSAGQGFMPKPIPAGSWPLPEGIPAAIARGGTIDLFAIGQGGIGQGGPLVHWCFDGVSWRDPVAYSSGLAAGGVTAVRGRSGLEAFGIQSGFNNCLLHWPSGIAVTEHTPWRNWAGNRQTNLEGHCYPQSLEELVAIVKGATRQGKRVRAVGSSWSFSDIAMTAGYLVETTGLNRILSSVLPRALIPNATSIVPIPGSMPAPKQFIHVEAGIILENLMTFLDANDLAPATMGGAAGQTLAGVISTCVHGSHFHLPPFPDWIRAIHLVGPDGRQYWIEPADRPITNAANNDKLLGDALGPDVVIKRNNDWFDAALVTVGSLGIVYSVIIEVRPAYKLRETRTAVKWSALRPRLVNKTVFTDSAPDAVQLAIDPGSMNKSDPDCYLSVREKIAMSFASTPEDTSFDPQAAFCEGDLLKLLYRVGSPVVYGTLLGILAAIPVVNAALAAALPVLGPIIATDQAVPLLYTVLKAGGSGAVGDFLGMVLDKNPGLTSTLITEMTKTGQRPGVGIDLAHQVMARRNKGECIARGLALEVALDTTTGAHLRFTDAAIMLLQAEAAAGRFLGGWFALRFVGKSRAMLSPQQTEMTCMIEFVGLRTLSSTRPVLAKLEALGRTHGAIQHWGMFEDLTGADVTRAYPRLDTWREVRWELTGGGTVHTFDNDFTVRCGLSSPPHPVAPRTRWSGWAGLGGGITQIATAVNHDGRVEVFAIGTDRALNHLWQTSPGGGWSGWAGLGGGITQIATAVNHDGRVEVFAIGTDRALNHLWQTSPGGGWSGWAGLGGGITQIATAVNHDGRVEVFAIGTDRALNHLWQTSPGGGWSGWAGLGGGITQIATAVNHDGRVEVFAIGTDKALNHMWQTSPGGGWSGWAGLGGGITQIATAMNQDGRVEVFAIGTDKALNHMWQTSPGGGWSGWAGLSGGITQIATAVNQDGRLEVFAIGTDRALNHLWQTSPGGGWSSWAGLGGGITQIATAVNHDGRVEVCAIGTDTALNHIWQTAPGG